VAKSGYSITTLGEVSLAAAGTVANILGVAGNANFGTDLQAWGFDFDGVDATQKPVRVGIYACTFATNPPGTNSTTVAIKQLYGRLAATGFSAAKTWTAAPTVIDTEPIDEFALDANKGVYFYPFPLGQTPDTPLGSGWLIRALIESADTVTAAIRARMFFERC
jgi:hypothetical protein